MIQAPAIFASAFHPHVGGVEELVRQLAGEQMRRGMHPVVVTNRHPLSLPAVDEVDGVPVVRHEFVAPSARITPAARWAALAPRSHAAVIRELRRRGTDLIHVQCVSSNASYALSASRVLGLPLVITMQGELSMDANQIYQRSTWLRRVWRRSLDAADVVTACSQYVLDEAEAVYGRPFAGRGVVIPNGIRLSEYGALPSASGEADYVLGIGRMVEQKGFDVLIEAFNELARERSTLRLVLAGDGPARSGLESQVRAAGLKARVTFLGRVDHQRAVELFSQAAVFALPSKHEPQGIVVLEAMAAGTPVVASDVGGVAELVDDLINGLLVKSGDPHGLARSIDRVLTDPGLAQRLRTGGLSTAAAHDWAETTTAYAAVYARSELGEK